MTPERTTSGAGSTTCWAGSTRPVRISSGRWRWSRTTPSIMAPWPPFSAAAEPLLLQGYEGIKQRADQIPPLGKRRLTEAIERLVRLYEASQQAEKARTWRAKLPADKAPV